MDFQLDALEERDLVFQMVILTFLSRVFAALRAAPLNQGSAPFLAALEVSLIIFLYVERSASYRSYWAMAS